MRVGVVPWHIWLMCVGLLAFVFLFNKAGIEFKKISIPYLIWAMSFLGAASISLLVVYRDGGSLQQFIQYAWMTIIGASIASAMKDKASIYSAGYAVLCATVLLAILTVLEFLDPSFQVIVDKYFEDDATVGALNRSGALFENPNNNGHAMVLGMFVSQFFLPQRLRLVLFALVGAGVFCTVSRTSLVVWGVAVVLSLGLGLGYEKKNYLSRFLGVASVVGLSAVLVTGKIPEILSLLNLEQSMTSGMMERLSSSFFDQSDGSTNIRKELGKLSLDLFLANPVFGAGLGATENLIDHLGSHNQFLKIAGEQGGLGLLVFMALMVVAFYSRSVSAVIFVLLFFTISLSSHSMFAYPAFSALIPIALIFVPNMTRGNRTRRVRRRRRRRNEH